MADTGAQFDSIVTNCRSLFKKKLHDYGAAWRIMRPESITDQIFIKAKRIRSLEVKGVSKIDEDIQSGFAAIINYGIIGLIQCEFGFTEQIDMTSEQVLNLYDEKIALTKCLMFDKNHDYDEAWRSMRVSSFTDIILQKVLRTKQIEDNEGLTLASEGVDANYQDMINYSIFALIRLNTENQ